MVEAQRRLFQHIGATPGRLGVLVNSAGTAPLVRAGLLESTRESLDYILNINLRFTFFMCRRAANPDAGYQKRGLKDYTPRIANIGSMSAYTSPVNRPAYCISKAGIGMVIVLFADRLAEEGIPMCEVRPGILMTDFI